MSDMLQNLTPILVFFGASAICALSGLVLVLLQRREPHATEVRILGNEVKTSSLGVVLIFIGLFAFALPFVVSERHAPGTGVASPPAAAAQGVEVEPNDDYISANEVRAGGSIAGTAAPRNDDWFVVPIDTGRSSLHVRMEVTENTCNIDFLSEREQELRNSVILDRMGAQWNLPLDGVRRVYLRVWNNYTFACSYRISTSYEAV